MLFILCQVITFIDLAGHEKYLKTTVFGMTGHAPDFSMLMVSSLHISLRVRNRAVVSLRVFFLHDLHSEPRWVPTRE